MSRLVTVLITSMGRAITSVAFTGFGFQGIGVGVTITGSGSTAITHHANEARLTFRATESYRSDDFLREKLLRPSQSVRKAEERVGKRLLQIFQTSTLLFDRSFSSRECFHWRGAMEKPYLLTQDEHERAF